MAYHVYKCNLNPEYGPDMGDWLEGVFALTPGGAWRYPFGVGWGEYARHGEFAKLEPGDLVIALQTGSKQVLVGLAEYVGDVGTGVGRKVKLRARELICTKLRPLKQADPKGVGKIDALQGGKVMTLYDITMADAKKLISAGRNARKKSIQAATEIAGSKAMVLTAKVSAAGGGFGDSETNRKVERAAVEAVAERLAREGWAVESVEQAKVGYDLRCKRGRATKHVEVKGIRGTQISFFITAAEVRQWRHDPRTEVWVVTSALSKPAITVFNRADVARFTVDPVLFRARIR